MAPVPLLFPACDLAALLAPLQAAAARSAELEAHTIGRVPAGDGHHALMRFRFRGPEAGHDPIRIGLFAGVHGDEPAGCAALVHFLLGLVAEPARAAGYDVLVYPVVNPTGYEDATRANREGRDLNREFWHGSLEPEVRCLEHELRTHAFAGVITLHADDTCEGHYGYSHGRDLDDSLLRPALLAAESVLPRDRRAVIDGFTAREGIISDCFKGILAPPPDQEPRAFNLIFETPAHAPFDHQVAAHVAALDAILATYRGFISYAQDL
jgi:murein peptide amidase A